MRRTLISVATVLLLVGAAGCSSSVASTSSGAGDEPGSGSGAGSSSTAAGGGSETGGSRSGSASSPPAGVLFGADSLPTFAADHCRTKNLTAMVRSTGQGRASVVITNKGDGSCTVRGFPSLLFIGEAGRTELPVDWAGSAADAAEVTLAPGGSASATLTFTGLDECEAVTALDVVPPGESRPLTPAFTTTGGKKSAVHICDTGVRVEAFSPSR